MPRQGIEIKASPEKQWLGVLLIQSMLLRASHTRDSAFKGSQEQFAADSAAAQQLCILIPGKTALDGQKSLERGISKNAVLRTPQ